MNSDVTVIVPTRHRTDYVDIAVRSILTSAAELERARGARTRVLIVDDAPDNDDTLELSKRLGVDYIRVEEHDGRADPGAAIALGVKSVDTRYQTIFGDDDVMLPRHLRAAHDLLSAGADVVSNSFQLTDETLRPYRTVILRPTTLGDLIAGHTMVNDGSFVAHDLVKDLPWDVALEGQMLVPIWGELMLAGRTFELVDEPTWLYRRHGSNISEQALSPKDVALRERVRNDLRSRAITTLGFVPRSPEHERLARRARFVARINRQPYKIVRRVRSKLVRVIRSEPYRDE